MLPLPRITSKFHPSGSLSSEPKSSFEGKSRGFGVGADVSAGTYFAVERFQTRRFGGFLWAEVAFVADWNSNSDNPANLALRWTSLAE
jgi:hypothetical protein